MGGFTDQWDRSWKLLEQQVEDNDLHYWWQNLGWGTVDLRILIQSYAPPWCVQIMPWTSWRDTELWDLKHEGLQVEHFILFWKPCSSVNNLNWDEVVGKGNTPCPQIKQLRESLRLDEHVSHRGRNTLGVVVQNSWRYSLHKGQNSTGVD